MESGKPNNRLRTLRNVAFDGWQILNHVHQQSQLYLIPELIGGDLIVFVTSSRISSVTPATQNIKPQITHQTYLTASIQISSRSFLVAYENRTL